MKLKDLYRMAVETGIKADPRTAEEIEAELKRAEEKTDSPQK